MSNKKKPAQKSSYLIQCERPIYEQKMGSRKWQDWYEWQPKPHLLHLCITRVQSLQVEHPSRNFRLIKRTESVIVPESKPKQTNERRTETPQKRGQGQNSSRR